MNTKKEDIQFEDRAIPFESAGRNVNPERKSRMNENRSSKKKRRIKQNLESLEF